IHRAAFASINVVALKKGYFDEALGKGNYSVHFFPQGKLMRQAILAGSLDTGTTGFRPFVVGIARGARLKGFAVTSYLCQMTRLMVRPDSPITNVKQIRGKKIALGKGTSVGFSFENFILPGHGLSEKDVAMINTVTTDRIPALRAKSVDVAIVIEPAVTVAESKGFARSIANFCKYDKSAMMSVVSPKTLAERRAQVRNYLRAWLKAGKYFKTNFDDYARIFNAHERARGQEVSLELTRRSLKSLIIAPELNQEMLEQLQRIARILKRKGSIPREPDFLKGKEALDMKLLGEAKGG
ncbi:MAG: ABC transporter substrate-binding protein, partial [Nitrospinota bacterium]